MILDEIVAYKRKEVERRKLELPMGELRAQLADAPPPRGFRKRLSTLNSQLSTPRIIAEIKKGSPSRGIIRFDFDPAAIAASYERNGAAALSALTDRRFFYGCLADMQLARKACGLPILRKDFTIDEYQIVEARAAGADAVLLIVAALGGEDIKRLLSASAEIGLDALVEVHDEHEMEIALANGANLIGINNRDLRTFKVDIGTTARLAAMVPDGVTLVSESGIKSAKELRSLSASGVHAALIGESLMSAADPGARLRELIGPDVKASGKLGKHAEAS